MVTTTTRRIVNESVSEAHQMADEINTAFQAGHEVWVNGHEVYSPWSNQPATVWMNGSVSVTVKLRHHKPGRTNETWVKSGQVAIYHINEF